jgi:uncharacterized repeat protein (TIGR01451 family)
MNKHYLLCKEKLYVIFFCAVLFGTITFTETQAQMYVTADPPGFYYYDIASNTFTAKANTPVNFASGANLSYDGTNIFAVRANASGVPTNGFYKYTVATNTWAAAANLPVVAGIGANSIAINSAIYVIVGNNDDAFLKYNIASNTWSTLANLPGTGADGGFLTWDGADYIYSTQGGTTGFHRYSISANTWTTLAVAPFIWRDGGTIELVGNYIYGIRGGGSTTTFARYDITANTWSTTLASLPAAVNDGGSLVHYNGALYTPRGDGTTDFYKYTIATNTWSTVGPFPSPLANGGYLLGAMSSCAPPVATVAAVQATCNSGTANANAGLQLSAFDANSKKVDYSIGSTYTGAGFASAAAVSGSAPFSIVGTLANPAAPQPYTVRVFCDAATYEDYLVVLQPKQCLTADLSVSVSPTSQTGNAGEFRTYTVTVTNVGPDTAPGVQVKVPMPSNGTYLTATPQQGTYNSNTNLWTIGNIPVGNVTMTLTVKVN